jgi:hypothetical protein
MGQSISKPNGLASGRAAIITGARQLAKRAVEDQLRSEGKHPCRMKASEISAMALSHLAEHPELHFEAFERACKMGLIDPEDREFFQNLLDLTKYLCSSDEPTRPQLT